MFWRGGERRCAKRAGCAGLFCRAGTDRDGRHAPLWRRYCLQRAGAAWGVRRHRCMELSGADRLLEGRAGAGCGKCVHSQTLGNDTAFGKPHCRAVCRGRPAGGIVPGDPWRLPYRPGDLRTSRHCQDITDRWRRDRQADHGAVSTEPEESNAGTGRKITTDCLCRCEFRCGGADGIGRQFLHRR